MSKRSTEAKSLRFRVQGFRKGRKFDPRPKVESTENFRRSLAPSGADIMAWYCSGGFVFSQAA